MVGQHHQLNGHEFEQTPGDSEGQGSLVCCISWDHKESDTTEQLKSNNKAKWTWMKYCQARKLMMWKNYCFKT